MSPNSDAMLAQSIDRLTNEVTRLSNIVAKLEAMQESRAEQCSERHSVIEHRFLSVEAEQKREEETRSDWSKWIVRTVAGALIASACVGGGYFARGCNPQNMVQK